MTINDTKQIILPVFAPKPSKAGFKAVDLPPFRGAGGMTGFLLNQLIIIRIKRLPVNKVEQCKAANIIEIVPIILQ